MKLIHRIKYRNLNKIPTKTIKAILDDPYTRGKDGKDYGPVREELEEILWQRLGPELIEAELKAMEAQEREEFEARQVIQREILKEAKQEREQLPPTPQDAPMASKTPLIRVLEYQGDEVTSFREFWPFDGSFLEIPAVILDF